MIDRYQSCGGTVHVSGMFLDGVVSFSIPYILHGVASKVTVIFVDTLFRNQNRSRQFLSQVVKPHLAPIQKKKNEK